MEIFHHLFFNSFNSFWGWKFKIEVINRYIVSAEYHFKF